MAKYGIRTDNGEPQAQPAADPAKQRRDEQAGGAGA